MQVKFNIAIALVNVFILFSTSDAQPGKQPIQLGVQLHHGFLLNHSPARTNKANAAIKSIYGFEINALWQTLGSKPWHRYYGFPKWGASFIYYAVGSGTTYVQYDKGDKTLYSVNWGDCYTLLIHSSLKPISTRFFEMNIRIGTGLGYFTSIYNANDNPGNLWISSRINPAMHLNIDGQFNINQQWALVVGGTFTHFSNGATRMPNLGVNFPTANVGLRFTPFPDRIKIKRDSVYSSAKKNYLHFSIAGGTKVLAEFGTTYYPTMAASVMYGRRLGKISKLLVSLDAFRDGSLLGDSLQANKNKDINRYGVWVGHEFLHGRLGLLFGLGYYFYKKTDRDANTYIKVGLRHYFHKNIFAGIVLKTHYGQADSFEWTLGCTL
ncbi:MAG: acyloxyacyl hydrolase [Cytophagales bacterium]